MSTHINDLPDDVLSDILSRLPIADAVRTSVLSKFWELKWTLIYDVKIDGAELPCYITPFIDIAEKMLLHLPNARNFHLSCDNYPEKGLSRLETLLSAIFSRRNTESLNVDMTDNAEGQGLILPRTLLNSTSLRNLTFQMPSTLELPVRSCFPNLKSFFLEGVNILNDNSNTDILILSFPVLETFALLNCEWLEVKCVEIDAPSLTSFSCITPRESGIDYTRICSIKILGSKNLAKFKLHGFCGHISLTGSTVEHAHLSCLFNYFRKFAESGVQIRKLLRELSHAKGLFLTNVLSAVSETKFGLPLPRFDRLIELRIEFRSGAEGLFELLHAAPFLKTLDIEVMDLDDYDYDSLEYLPSCVHHLEEITFRYTGHDRHYRGCIEKFFLKNGVQLKKVHVYGQYRVNEIVNQLSSFPKGSTCLKIYSSQYFAEYYYKYL